MTRAKAQVLFRSKETAGYQRIVSPENSPLQKLTFGRLRLLENGERHRGSTGRTEVVLDILGGRCDVSVSHAGKSVQWQALGERATPFEGPPTLVCLPPLTDYEVKAQADGVDIVIVQGPSESGNPPTIIQPEEVQTRAVGTGNWLRTVHMGTVGKGKTRVIMVGETVNPPGHWSSYPPHKHDEDKRPLEWSLEEVYFYLLNPRQGFGLQRVYDRSETEDHLDQVFAVHHGDALVLTRGYHPLVAAGGYELFYLWALYGPEQAYGAWSEDPDHAWLHQFEKP